MALVQVASDNFNRADGGLGANWTNGPNGNSPAIVSQVVTSAVGFNDSDAFWNANAFNNNQYSQATFKALDADSFMGVTVRHSATDFVTAQNQNNIGGVEIIWYNGGAFTSIASDTAGELVANDVVRLEAEGTTFRMYVNGSLRISGTNASAPASGRAGILVTNSGDQLDDWSGGNIVADGSTPTRMLMGMGT